ncbi:hypothetical protein EJ04DRAFT_582465 [Polyplosphaeria fusca]|uniref:F-box domain-containing protein n=1 Tax=Polyplosphaeria fusca TaxID=682080 RepID=A0A9P4QL08_9PLEO|nr:hypothetical protein EJ04DRAFT_582465 [Polyplosphaeria fusca]
MARVRQKPLPASVANAHPTEAPSSSRVFGVYELLEAILLYLPMRFLLLAQGVNRCWKATIDSSKPIQCALFFLPRDPDSEPVKNELIEKVFARFFRMTLLTYHWTKKDFKCIIKLKTTRDLFGKGWKNTNASWRKMLMIQPPVFTLEITDNRVAPDYHDCFNDPVNNKEGVRLADLLVLEDTFKDEDGDSCRCAECTTVKNERMWKERKHRNLEAFRLNEPPHSRG